MSLINYKAELNLKSTKYCVLHHVMYAFQSESALYSYLNVKELPTQNRPGIWSLSISNGARTHSNLIRKRTLDHFEKLVMVWLNGWVFVYELSCCEFESRCSSVICLQLIMKILLTIMTKMKIILLVAYKIMIISKIFID